MINEKYKYTSYDWDSEGDALQHRLISLARQAEAEGIILDSSPESETKFMKYLHEDEEREMLSCMFEDAICCSATTLRICHSLGLTDKKNFIYDVCSNAYHRYYFDKTKYNWNENPTYLYETFDFMASDFITWFKQSKKTESFEDLLLIRYSVTKLLFQKYMYVDGKQLLYGIAEDILTWI